MKQEKLFEALGEIGDDLLLMAQTKRFINHWKRWGRTAACLALVLCLTVLALPYFPMGCGAKEEAPAEAPAECPAEEMAPIEVPAEAPAAEEAPAEEPPDIEGAPEAEEETAPEEVVSVWFGDVRYEIVVRYEFPEDLGDELGTVEQSDGRDLNGNRVFAVLNSENIYVELGDGLYLLGTPAS